MLAEYGVGLVKLTVACKEIVDGVVCKISKDSSLGLIKPPMELPNGAIEHKKNQISFFGFAKFDSLGEQPTFDIYRPLCWDIMYNELTQRSG